MEESLAEVTGLEVRAFEIVVLLETEPGIGSGDVHTTYFIMPQILVHFLDFFFTGRFFKTWKSPSVKTLPASTRRDPNILVNLGKWDLRAESK